MAVKSNPNLAKGTDLLRKGAVLLSDSCSKCGGLQVKYNEQVLCLSCSSDQDISNIESYSFSDVMGSLKTLSIHKMFELQESLKNESDLNKQNDLVSLILKYAELLDCINNSDSAQKDDSKK